MREIDTVIGDSLGGSVSLALEDKYRHNNIDIPGVGIKQVKTFNAPVVAGGLGGNNKTVKDLIVNSGHKLGSAIGGTIGVGLDGLTGFADEGLCTARLSKSGGELEKKAAGRLTTRPDNNPNRIRYFGYPISVVGINDKNGNAILGRQNDTPSTYIQRVNHP